MMYLGLSYLIQEGHIANDTVLRYLTGHPVSKVTVVMFFIGMASLVLIAKNLVEQFGNEKKITFKTVKPQQNAESTTSAVDVAEAEASGVKAVDVGQHAVELGNHLLSLPKWMQEHYLWQRLVDGLHSVYRTNSTAAVEDELKFLAEMDLDRQQQRYSLVRILIWATPMLGFLGTVLGISQALGGINVGPENNFQSMMDGLRSSLYVAFDTTALALTLSMVMMFAQFLVERFELQLLGLVDQRAKQEIASEFDMTVGSSGDVDYQDVVKQFLTASREAIEEQTENWRSSMRSSEQAWVSSVGTANAQVQSQLCHAVDESVSNLASSLGSAIDRADHSMSHRWGQWQVTLSDNARMMAGYQEQLAQQTEMIHNLLEKSQSKGVFEPALEQNREAVEATSQLRKTLDDLAVAIAELQTRPAGESNANVSTARIEMPVVQQPLETFEPSSRIASVHPAAHSSGAANADVIFPTRTRRNSRPLQPQVQSDKVRTASRNSKRVA